jgi:hypothetical protein
MYEFKADMNKSLYERGAWGPQNAADSWNKSQNSKAKAGSVRPCLRRES